jgi:nucleoside-diphosphate-sugar epimerase
LPSNQSPLGARPARFRRPRLLIVGCGDVGQRVARAAGPGMRVLALTSSPGRIPSLRAQGITPLAGNLDAPATLRRLAGLATHVVHMAPPPGDGQSQWWRDPRTQALLRTLRLRTAPAALVYGSTSGVYGDCAGALVNETAALKASTPRAQRRVDAETLVRHFGRATLGGMGLGGTRASILRIPGIYAPDRDGGTPRARLLKRTPVLAAADDVYTNHIHADDLARACLAALWRGRPQRIYNASDDTRLKMGDYFDLAADLYCLPRPPRVPRSTAQAELPLMLLSFMSESRQMDNTRLKAELRVRLRYPTVQTGLVGG